MPAKRKTGRAPTRDALKAPSGQKGRDTRERIIAVARSILVDEGYDKFVVRQISARVGIRPGNLQYYFASKKELLQAVLEREMVRYHEAFTSVTNGKTRKKGITRALVNFLLDEIRLKATCNIWYTVWALAPHDGTIAALMDEWYQKYLAELRAVLRTAEPTMSERRAGHIAGILTATMDGLTNQIGYGKVPHDIHRSIEDSVRTLFQRLVATEA